MQSQARRAVFIAVRLFDTDKKATKLNRARIFTESQVCFSRMMKEHEESGIGRGEIERGKRGFERV